ncbi:hypothetical protein LAV73_21930 [Lysinibacillus xylanilyticus]|uniref:hypothetical protein n=1 Tax=Lysinibacillus xylanilyticus TaxID=582475 RepID=UPI002B24F3E1|nr:hypothetical protein [Lysinibacillus xylanilyticus]MEB2282590.1 hypothetical protein [Lysinibacillus xylanilyticus]
MRKPKMYFVIACQSHILLSRSILLVKVIIMITALCLLISTKQSYLVITLFLFLGFFILKLIPMPHQDSIEVYFDHLIYKTKIKEVELYFNQISFIDQDVVEGQKGESYYKSIEFLDETMSSLLYIDGISYSYDGLVILCNRIYSVNQELSSLRNTSESTFSVNYEKHDLS